LAEGVSEEKIKMRKVNGRMTSDGKSSHCLWQDELKKINNHSMLFETSNLVIKVISKKLLSFSLLSELFLVAGIFWNFFQVL
jgi:hypothetical protein